MHRWRHLFFVSGSLVALAALVGTVAPATMAQVRAALVRDVDSQPRSTRFAANTEFAIFPGSLSENDTLTPAIPAGKRFVVQAVSIRAILTDGQSPREAQISLPTSGGLLRVWTPMTLQSTADILGRRNFYGNQDLNVVLDSGQSIDVFLARNGSEGPAQENLVHFSFRGYLVDVN